HIPGAFPTVTASGQAPARYKRRQSGFGQPDGQHGAQNPSLAHGSNIIILGFGALAGDYQDRPITAGSAGADIAMQRRARFDLVHAVKVDRAVDVDATAAN